MKSTRPENEWRNGWRWTYFLAAVCVLAHSCETPAALDKQWPGYRSLRWLGDAPGSYKSAPVREGFLLTRKGDTLKGYTKIYEYNETGSHLDAVSFLPYGKTTEADIIHVPLGDVDYIRVKRRDTVAGTQDYWVLRANLWEVLESEGPVAVCTLTWHQEGSRFRPMWGNALLLVSENDLIDLPSLEGWGQPVPYASITRFINRRYGEHLDPGFFKSGRNAIVHHILNKENEKIRSAAGK